MRKLIAALACRNGGSRLYGKPLQVLANGKTVLDQILDTVKKLPCIETAVLGIAEGEENLIYRNVAWKRGIPFVVGDETDVLSRLIECGRSVSATDIFRVTTECPFLHSDPFEQAWIKHVENNNDVTTTDGLPEGTHFEIYRLSALEVSHERGTSWHRSEGCSRYIREHRDQFRVEVLLPDAECARMDLRLTVDYPEDLVLCRKVYEAFHEKSPLIPLREIIDYLDNRPDLKALVEPYVKPMRLWPEPAVKK